MFSIKKILLFALILLLTGAIGSIFTFSTFKQAAAVNEEMSFNNNISAIEVNASHVGVNVLPVKEQAVKVELTGHKSSNTNYELSAEVDDTTQLIKAVEKQQSYISLNSLMLTVYLPEQQYESLYVNSNNGQVRAESLSIEDVTCKTTNGMIELKSITAKDVRAETNNGEITFYDVQGKVSGTTQNDLVKPKRTIRSWTG